MIFGFASHAVAAVAYLGLGLLLLASRRGGGLGLVLMLACGLTTLWAAVVAFDYWSNGRVGTVSDALEVVRSAGWLVFTAGVFATRRTDERTARTATALIAAILVLSVALVGLEFAPSFHAVSAGEGLRYGLLGRLVLAVTGLVLIENMYRNSKPSSRWAIKFLCLGIGAMFAYDLYVYADALLFRRLNPSLLQARGATNTIVVPLLAVSAARNREWSLDIFVSRRIAFHSTTLIGAGLYLLLMAGAGYYLRAFGGDWGTVLQTTFLFGAVVLLAVVLFSGRFRAEVKVFLNKHFFNYKFDYREEWLQFIHTISSADRSETLPGRAIQAVADIVDSPDGALWMRREGEGFALVANSDLPLGTATHLSVDGSLPRFLEERAWVINLAEIPERPELYADLDLPQWLGKIERAWLVVPLHHHDALLGFVVLGRPRAHRDLNWEDYDLLRTVGRQVASYLAEQEAEKAMLEAKQFEAFNRRFAFVLHDIKNLVSQLSLLVSNADRHAGNPEFQEDMIRTVRDSVDRMNRLLARLSKGREESPAETVSLAPLLAEVVGRLRGTHPSARLVGPTVAAGAAETTVAADRERLAAVLGHLIQNAVEATADHGEVAVDLERHGDRAVIEIADDGPGMDSEFVREHLFRPFGTTKRDGFGIGAYESREFIRGLGGNLDVVTAPGRGTKMRIDLPVLAAVGGDDRAVRAANAR